MPDVEERMASLGEFIRDRRNSLRLSLRKLSEQAGISNPYLSQIERGLRKPSAEILQSIAKALRVSAETLYVQAGILDERDEEERSVVAAIFADTTITDRQRQVLIDIYESFRRENRTEDGAERAGPTDRVERAAARHPQRRRMTVALQGPARGDGASLAFHSGADAFGRMRAQWERAAAAMPGFGPFLGPAWCETWWRSAVVGDPDPELWIGEFAGGELVLPMYRSGGVASFLGGRDVTDYVGPVGPFELHAAAGEALVNALARDASWTTLLAVAVPAESGFTVAAGLAALRHEFDVSFTNEESTVLRLPATFDDYLVLIGKKERHESRRKERRLARELGLLELETDSAAGGSLDAAVDLFVDLHRRSAGDKGTFMTDAMAQFFHAAAATFAGEGCLRLDVLRAGGVPVAATVGFRDEHGYYLYNSAFDPEYGTLSPGNVLLGMLIRREIDAGTPIFDFLRGAERYKFRLGGVSRPLRRLEIRRRSPATG